jgi:preprotein translocase subunit SecF
MQISLDKLFQKKIQTSEVNLPSEVWIAIETKLRKRRRVRIFWSVFVISFVILIISILIFYPPKKELPINFYKNTNLKELKDEQVKTKKKSNLGTDLKNKKTKKIFSSVSNISVEKRSELSNSQNYNTIKTKDNNKLESNRHKKAYDYNKTEEILKDDSFQKNK